MRLSPKESRTKSLNATNLDRKSGIRGPKTMGEAPPKLFDALHFALRNYARQRVREGFRSGTPKVMETGGKRT
jgi:hypothetical protein